MKSKGMPILITLLLAAGLPAQEYRGRIQGNVTDPSSAVVSGATVRLVNVATGVENLKQTDSHGRYLFDLVEPGTLYLDGRDARLQPLPPGKHPGPEPR